MVAHARKPTISRRPSGPKIHLLALDQITIDPDIQPRASEDIDTIMEYAAAWKSGAKFPPVDVFWDNSTYWLADGFQRVKGAQKAGLDSIRANVYLGDRRDAILHAAGANAEHGVRRTNADKRKVILRLLDDPKWCLWTDVMIARHCKVSPKMVGNYRSSMPELRGHGVTARINAGGQIINTPAATAGVEPNRNLQSPLTRGEIVDLYLSRIAAHLRKFDGTVRTHVKHELGVADLVTNSTVYRFVLARDSTDIYRTVGHLIVDNQALGGNRAMAIIGHFTANNAPLRDMLADAGIACYSPEQMLNTFYGKERS